MSYTVEENNHGVLIRGAIPVEELLALSVVWQARGMKTLVPGVAQALGATMAVCRDGHEAAWKADAEDVARVAAGDDPELLWLLGTDTGASSKTMFRILSVRNGHRVSYSFNALPLDPDDFGRCVRLLEKFPEWRTRMALLGAADRRWFPLIREWKRIEELYHEELPLGRAPKCYAAIQACLKEAGL